MLLLLVRWAEHPPKWSIIKPGTVQKVDGKDYRYSKASKLDELVGRVVMVMWEKKLEQGTVIRAGKHAALETTMRKEYELMQRKAGEESSTSFDSDSEQEAPPKRRAPRRVAFSQARGSEVLEQLARRDAAESSQLARRDAAESSQSLLVGLTSSPDNVGCSNCEELTKDVSRLEAKVAAMSSQKEQLEGQVKMLQDTLVANGDLRQLVERYESTAVWLDELKETIKTAKVMTSQPEAATRSDAEGQAQNAVGGAPEEVFEDPPSSQESNMNQATTPEITGVRAGARDRDGDIEIGPGGTKLSIAQFRAIPWRHPNQNKPVRELLVCVFGNDTLATSSLTGRPSNNMGLSSMAKEALDRVKLEDVMHACQRKLGMSKQAIHRQVTAVCNNCAKVRRRSAVRSAAPTRAGQIESGPSAAERQD